MTAVVPGRLVGIRTGNRRTFTLGLFSILAKEAAVSHGTRVLGIGPLLLLLGMIWSCGGRDGFLGRWESKETSLKISTEGESLRVVVTGVNSGTFLGSVEGNSVSLNHPLCGDLKLSRGSDTVFFCGDELTRVPHAITGLAQIGLDSHETDGRHSRSFEVAYKYVDPEGREAWIAVRPANNEGFPHFGYKPIRIKPGMGDARLLISYGHSYANREAPPEVSTTAMEVFMYRAREEPFFSESFKQEYTWRRK